MNEMLLISVVFVTTTVCIVAVALLVQGVLNSESVKVKKRFESIHPHFSSISQDQQLALLKKENDWGKYDLFSEFPPLLNLPLLFAQAGMTISMGKWFIINFSVATAVGCGGWLWSHQIIYAVGTATITFLGFYLFVVWKRSQRIKKFEAHLAQALEVIGRSLRAGHPFSMGIYMVYTELPDPIGTEFGQVFHQQQMGIPVDEALKSMTQRVPLMDLRFFVLSIMIHSQTGGDLAEILDNLAKVIRERFKVLGQVKALTAEGRLSGWVLCALPVFVFFVLLTLNRDYVMLLLTEERGQNMMWFAGIMQIIGMLVIRKIVNIKV